MRKIIKFVGVELVLIWLLPAMIHAAAVVNDKADIILPEITIITPTPDSITDTAHPWIEVRLVDTGSGLQLNTLRLYLDDIDVTRQARVEALDVTGQAIVQPVLVRYQPQYVLARGTHKLYIRIQDNANNLAEARWSFQVNAGPDKGIRLSGTNILQIEKYPIDQVTDNIDLNLLAWLGNTRVRFNQQGQIDNGPPHGNPVYDYEGYSVYNNGYTLGISHRNLEALWGKSSVPVQSELLQMDSTVDGLIVNYQFSNASGNYQWAAFSGEVGSSYGMRIDIDQYEGVTATWRSPAGVQLNGFYVSSGAKSGLRHLGINGSLAIRQLLVRMETIHGERDDTTGNAWALHLDQPFGSAYFGLDYYLFQPDYPEDGSPASFFGGEKSSGNRRYNLRANTRLGENQQLRFQGSFTEDNLDRTDELTDYRENYYVDYQILLSDTSVVNLNYQDDYQHQHDGSVKLNRNRTRSVFLGYQQKYHEMTFNSSIATSRQNIDTGKSSTTEYLLSCTYPMNKFNLTPSISWQQDKDRAEETDSLVDIRITADFGWSPELNRSRLALYHQIDKDGKSRQTTHKTGVEATLYLKSGNHSTFMLGYAYYFWKNDTKGNEPKTLRLEWRLQF